VPDLVLAGLEAEAPHADWPLFTGKRARDGAAIAYACRGYRCDAPTSDPDALRRAVARLAEPTPEP